MEESSSSPLRISRWPRNTIRELDESVKYTRTEMSTDSIQDVFSRLDDVD